MPARLLIIPYFERVVDGRVKNHHDITIDLELGPLQSVYLTYEEGGIGVITVCGLISKYFIRTHVRTAFWRFPYPPDLPISRRF
jgi:hypothetical protein